MGAPAAAPTATAKSQQRHLAEAARATVLAAHAAAGLCTSARSSAAARLLRSAEATARAAVALLVAPADPRAAAASARVPPTASARPSGSAASPPAGTRSARRRRQRKKTKNNATVLDMSVDNVDAPGELSATAPALSAEAAEFVPGAQRRVVLPRRSPYPTRSSSSAPAASSTAPGADAGLPAGASVTFTGLVSRPELVGMAGVILSFDEKASRYAVKVRETGESIRVLPKNLVKCCAFNCTSRSLEHCTTAE